MMKSLSPFFRAAAVLALFAATAAGAATRDIVLVFDNSGSMRKNDPGFVARAAVQRFIDGLEDGTSLEVIVFDAKVRVAAPATIVDAGSRARLRGSLDGVDYRGRLTDSPAAMERAIYDLKNGARADAEKSVVFLTDGIVDTGNQLQDATKTAWLREDLTADAAGAGIRIYAVAFTQNADFMLIQSLSQRTGGEYYRAMEPADLAGVFERIDAAIKAPRAVAAPEPAAPAAAAEPPAPASAPAVAPETEELPPEFQNLPPGAVVVQKPSESESWAALIIIAVGGLVLVGLVVALVLYLKRRPASAAGVAAADAADAPCAYLNDLHGITRDPAYEIGAKPVMLGRVAGTDRALDYIVVNQATVGRRHAIIEYKDFSYWIIDQGSTNGTFVNAERVEGERRLRHGDRIRLHNFEFEFVLPELDEGGKTLFVGNADQQLAEKTVVAASAAGLAAMGAAQAVDHAPAQSAYDPAQDDEFLDITSEREEDESDDTQMLAEQAAEDFHEGPTEMREPVPAAEPAQSDTLLRAYGGAPAAAPAAPAPDFNELETFARNEPLAGAGDDVSLDAFMDIDDSDAAASPGSPASLTGEFAELQTLVRGGAPAEREDGPEVSLDEFMSTSVFERGPDAPVAGESDRTVLAPHGPGGAGDYHDGGTVVLDSPLAAAPERDTSEDPTVLPSAAAPVPPAAPAASIDLAEDVTVAPGFGAGASVEDEMTLDEFVNASVYPGTAQDEGTRLQPRPEDDRTRVQPRPGSQEFPDPEQDDPDRTLMPSQVQDPPPKR